MDNSLIKEKLKNYNTHYSHPSYNYERKLLRAIKSGSEEDAVDALDHIGTIEKPTLAGNSLRSVRNSLIASCTLYTRAAIESGIDTEDAFDLSDVFIKHIETLTKEKDLIAFEYEMALKFLQLVKRKRTNQYKYPISKIVKYIYENATNIIAREDLAQIAHLSPDYLSKLFYEELGMHVTDFIQMNKVETAKNFMEFSEMTITEISTLLQFCNPAYFSRVFKKHTGKTPNDYRRSINNY